MQRDSKISELTSLYSYMWNEMKRPNMSSPSRDDLLSDIRTELEMDEDLIAGNLSYLVGGTMPPKIQIENALKLSESFFGYIKKIGEYKSDNQDQGYIKELNGFIEDLKRINDRVITLSFGENNNYPHRHPPIN